RRTDGACSRRGRPKTGPLRSAPVLGRKRDDARPRGRRIRKLRLLVLLLILFLLGTTSFLFGLVRAIATGIPTLDPARAQAQQVNGYVYASDGHTVLAVLHGSQSRVLVDWNEISPWMTYAIVDTEDKRFWQHRGVDLHGI